MSAREQVREAIRAAFGPVPFPSHCGLRGALLIDEWRADPALLRRTTAQQDIHGEWWEIPAHELRACALAIAYLDAAGVEFYLPAYLTLALDDLSRARLWALNFLDPEINGVDEDPKRRDLFHQRLSRIVGAKRNACIAFLDFVQSQSMPQEPEIARDARRILQHPFWR